MKLLTRICLFIVTSSAVFSCIALEDEFFPTATNNITSDKVFYYFDSLHVNVDFRDNALITESNVRLALIEPSVAESDTVLFSFDTTYTTVEARLLRFDSTFIIPLYAQTGKYLLATNNKDASDNTIWDSTYFYIDTDTTAPFVEQFSVVSKNEKNIENNQFCRGDIVSINALVTDNAALDRVGISIDEEETVYFNLAGRSAGIANLIQNDISIPNSINDGSHQLQLVIEDKFGNAITVSKTITVMCDNDPAELVLFEEESGIELPSNNVVQLFPGEEFNLSSLIFEDTGGLDSAQLEITRQANGNPTVETPVTFGLDGVTSADLSDIFEDYFSFSFDKVNANEGDEIMVNVKVKDINQIWEKASSFHFTLISKKDEKPELLIPNLIINGNAVSVNPDEEYDLTDLLIENGNLTIELDGEIREEVGLTSVKYTFNSDHRSIQSFGRRIDISEEELDYPLPIETVIQTPFPIDYNENLEGKITYSLQVIATDFKEQSDTVNFVLSAVY
ncbi:hypothetical protein [Flammeovirga sp. SJP92]|uniref:hypothetical protein n=1 Tax=Flammeovirga sp. SJP92 TaxID=1775430 RepID=UPI000788BF2B|nr:hypothetical protein [Flammeovirga sp. SJP92]KXX69530.1 hypothetical protein AVL50_15780 [Flammeovirga sp. SJP92]